MPCYRVYLRIEAAFTMAIPDSNEYRVSSGLNSALSARARSRRARTDAAPFVVVMLCPRVKTTAQETTFRGSKSIFFANSDNSRFFFNNMRLELGLLFICWEHTRNSMDGRIVQ